MGSHRIASFIICAALIMLLSSCDELFDETKTRFTSIVRIKNDCVRSTLPPFNNVNINFITAIGATISHKGGVEFRLPFGTERELTTVFEYESGGTNPGFTIFASLWCDGGGCGSLVNRDIGAMIYHFRNPHEIADGATIYNTFAVSELDENARCFGF